MHPVAHEGLTGCSFTLSSFAFVMRENQVGATAMQVDGRVEFTQGQGRTFNVPTRTARAPERFPTRLVGRRWLPENKIEWITLIGIVRVSAMLSSKVNHLLTGVMRNLAESLERTHIEIHRAAALVGMTLIEHHSDESANVSYCARGPWLTPTFDNVQCFHVGIETSGFGSRQV